jgi:hypothetical protein
MNQCRLVKIKTIYKQLIVNKIYFFDLSGYR